MYVCAYVPYDCCLGAWTLLSWAGRTLNGAQVPGVYAEKGSGSGEGERMKYMQRRVRRGVHAGMGWEREG